MFEFPYSETHTLMFLMFRWVEHPNTDISLGRAVVSFIGLGLGSGFRLVPLV